MSFTNIKTNNHPLHRMSLVDVEPLRIHIGNIPFNWTDKHLREQFNIFGPIDHVEVASYAQRSKGFGFVTFLRRGDAERAMQVKNGTIADGRKITVSLAVGKNQSTVFRSMPSSSLSPDAPMWTPLLSSPESQSIASLDTSPPLSSSAEWSIEQHNIKNYSTYCFRCGRSIY